MDESRELARLFFWSFVRVATALVLLWILLPLSVAAVSYLFFPETWRLFTELESLEFRRLAINEAGRVFPAGLCAGVIAIQVVAGGCAGWLLARLERPPRLLPAILLSIALLAMHLQTVLAEDRLFPLIPGAFLMAASALAVLAGGQFAAASRRRELED